MTNGTTSSDARSAKPLFVLTAAAICVALGWLSTISAEFGRASIALSSAVIVAVVVVLGRQDITRPEIIFPALWMSGVAVSQFPVLGGYESPWSSTMIIIAYAVPALFALGSIAAGGRVQRPVEPVSLAELNVKKLRLFAVFLLGVGILGIAVKSQRTGGIALLSSDIDSLRSAGGIKIPAWITMMTDCLFLGAWASLLAARIDQTRAGRNLSYTLAIVGFAGVALGASRNTLLLALLVPAFFNYLVRGRSRAGSLSFAKTLVLAAVVLTVISGLFFVRTQQHRTTAFESDFYTYVVPRTPVLLRPLLPLYTGFAAPLETLNRTIRFASSASTTGTYSVPGIPPRISPFGPRGDFYAFTGRISAPYYFNVATFVGPPYLDGGLALALLAALFLGALAGLARRLLLRSAAPANLAAIAYLSYLVAFLIYENAAAFYTLSVAFDLIVLWLVVRSCTGFVEADKSSAVRDT